MDYVHYPKIQIQFSKYVRAGHKPGSVSRSSHPHRDNGHSSSLDVAIEIKRPTRELGRTTLQRSPIWSCSRWGLPSTRCHQRDWWALTSPFHPYHLRISKISQGAVSFLWHFPSRHRDWALPSTLSCGARTFLSLA